MKVVILAGGIGTRLSEETVVRPKPMVAIGEKPILWHIMMHYSTFGFDEFVVCLGFKGEQIKRFFADSLALSSDVTIDFAKGTIDCLEKHRQQWRVTLVDTGLHTQTGGRIARVQDFLGDETFLMTYGDAVADVDLDALTAHHRRTGRLATVTAVHPAARFGQLTIDGDNVTHFDEKSLMVEDWINGGYFMLEPGIFDYIPGDVDWAREPMNRLADAGQLTAYRHEGFWQCMDTVRDMTLLNRLWDEGSPAWKVW